MIIDVLLDEPQTLAVVPFWVDLSLLDVVQSAQKLALNAGRPSWVRPIDSMDWLWSMSPLFW